MMFTFDENIMRELRAAFKVEAAEHLQGMNRVLLALEGNPEDEERSELLEEIFREAHSLKGAAGAAEFAEVQQTAPKLENVFGAARGGKIILTRDLCDVLYHALDAVDAMIQAGFQDKEHGFDLAALHARLDAAEQGQVIPGAIAAPGPTPEALLQPIAPTAEKSPPAASALPKPEETSKTIAQANSAAPERRKRTGQANPSDETIRVATSKLDSLMARSGELLVTGLKIEQRLKEIKAVGDAIEELNREWIRAKTTNGNSLGQASEKSLLRLMDLFQDKLRTLSTQIYDVERGLGSDAMHLGRVTNDLGEGVMQVRMLPVSSVLDAFPRLGRDIARELGKQVELEIEGTETELDRKVLEEIIEMPEERVRVGKPRQGGIRVTAFQKGNNLVIRRFQAELADESQVPAPNPNLGMITTRQTEIVAIGSSTGGPAALYEILSGLKADFPVPIVIVQHISFGFVQGLADRLNTAGPLRVRLGNMGDPLKEASCVVFGMSKEAIARGAARQIVPLDQIAPRLREEAAIAWRLAIA